MGKHLLLFLIFISANGYAQFIQSDSDFVSQLNLSGGMPSKLLATRSVVFYSYGFSDQELISMQDYFQRTGIDAIGYFTIDVVTAGRDISKSVSEFLLRREVTNLVFAEKNEENFRITLTTFNNKESIIDAKQNAWSVTNRLLLEALKTTMRSAQAELKKENLLINDYPETDIILNPIVGKRNEFYAVDMKVDLVAIPRFGDENMDKQLADILASNFPFDYKLVEPNVSEKDLRKQGFFYVMHFIHTRGEVARDLLGYKESKPETAIVSVTYPENQLQLKTIPSNAKIYKVYFKHIDSGNVFLGTKWDADLTWQQALLNDLRGMKVELRLN